MTKAGAETFDGINDSDCVRVNLILGVLSVECHQFFDCRWLLLIHYVGFLRPRQEPEIMHLQLFF